MRDVRQEGGRKTWQTLDIWRQNYFPLKTHLRDWMWIMNRKCQEWPQHIWLQWPQGWGSFILNTLSSGCQLNTQQSIYTCPFSVLRPFLGKDFPRQSFWGVGDSLSLGSPWSTLPVFSVQYRRFLFSSADLVIFSNSCSLLSTNLSN